MWVWVVITLFIKHLIKSIYFSCIIEVSIIHAFPLILGPWAWYGGWGCFGLESVAVLILRLYTHFNTQTKPLD